MSWRRSIQVWPSGHVEIDTNPHGVKLSSVDRKAVRLWQAEATGRDYKLLGSVPVIPINFGFY